jgi:hypothetical protein
MKNEMKSQERLELENELLILWNAYMSGIIKGDERDALSTAIQNDLLAAIHNERKGN